MTAVRHTRSSEAVVLVPKSTDFTMTVDGLGQRFIANAALTITLPTPGILGGGFRCEVLNDSGGSVVIDGIGDTNVTMSDGDLATIYETNSKQLVEIEPSTVLGDFFAEDQPWDPSVFGIDYDLVKWWDAKTGVTLGSTGLLKQWNNLIGTTNFNQSDITRQSTWLNQDEVRLNGHRIGHNIPTQSRAHYETKWVLLLIRFNWTAMQASVSDDFFLTINGTTNVNGQKQPQLRYLRATHQISTDWYSDGGLVSLVINVPGADDTWHSLVCRRTDTHIYASIDGAPEVSLACYPRAFLDTGAQPVGFLGNPAGSTSNTMAYGIDTLIWGQREISASEIAKAHAWMLWKRGAQASLDASSPYLIDAPLMSLADRHVQGPDSWADGYRFPLTGGWDDTVQGTALDLSGFTRTFHDHFTSLGTVTNGLTGAGPWYAPAHIDTSPAKFRRPGQTPLDTFTLLPDNTTLQIKIQKLNTDPLSTVYASGHMQSVDSWRNGFTQAVPTGGSSYFEARMAMNAIGTDVNGNIVTPAPAWNAFWLYSPLDARDSAATKGEVDVVECYGDRDPSINELHIAGHRHGAYRPQPGNASSPGNSQSGTTSSHTPSKIVDVTQAPWNVSPSLFDGQGAGQPGTFHTYGVMIDETWITWYFDGLVVSRFATYKEALDPLYMLVSLQSQHLDPLGIPGQGGGTPDCTSYLWVDYVDAWIHS